MDPAGDFIAAHRVEGLVENAADAILEKVPRGTF